MAAGTVTYQYPPPVAGTAVGPTPTQMGAGHFNKVVADVAFASADTVATITHGMQLVPADGTLGIPDVSVIQLAAGALGPLPIIAFPTLNTITIDRAATGATLTATYRVTIRRPHSLDK